MFVVVNVGREIRENSNGNNPLERLLELSRIYDVDYWSLGKGYDFITTVENLGDATELVRRINTERGYIAKVSTDRSG